MVALGLTHRIPMRVLVVNIIDVYGSLSIKLQDLFGSHSLKLIDIYGKLSIHL
jgi:hypothetical protein